MATRSRDLTVSIDISGACLGFSFESTVTAAVINPFDSGQSIPIASAQTSNACFAALGAVPPPYS